MRAAVAQVSPPALLKAVCPSAEAAPALPRRANRKQAARAAQGKGLITIFQRQEKNSPASELDLVIQAGPGEGAKVDSFCLGLHDKSNPLCPSASPGRLEAQSQMGPAAGAGTSPNLCSPRAAERRSGW